MNGINPTRSFLSILVAALLLWLLGTGPGWYHTMQLRATVCAAYKAVAALKQERQRLITQIQAHEQSQSGSFVIEKKGRESLYVAQQNEVVYY